MVCIWCCYVLVWCCYITRPPWIHIIYNSTFVKFASLASGQLSITNCALVNIHISGLSGFVKTPRFLCDLRQFVMAMTKLTMLIRYQLHIGLVFADNDGMDSLVNDPIHTFSTCLQVLQTGPYISRNQIPRKFYTLRRMSAIIFPCCQSS